MVASHFASSGLVGFLPSVVTVAPDKSECVTWTMFKDEIKVRLVFLLLSIVW